MIKTLNNTIKQDRTAYKIPRSVQDVIPIQRIFADGIFQFGTKYSRTLRFSDINYAIASKEDKTAMFLGYSELLNALDSGSTTKLTICNKPVNRQAFEDTVLLPQRGDSLDGFVNEFNGMLEGKISGSSASVEQERFITVSVHKKNVDEARTFFSRVTGEVSSKLSRLNSSSNELDAAERLDVLRGFFRPEEAVLPFDLQSAMKRGHNLKDTICPDSLEFHRDYFKMGSQYGRVLFLKDYASYIKDSMILELTDLNRRMMLSIDMIPVPTDEAVREVENKLLGVETNVTNWQRRQNSNQNFSAVVPYDLEQQRKETREMLDDLTTRDQRMLFAVVTLVHLADSKEELDSDTETLQSIARKHLCQLAKLSFQHQDGLVTALPLGLRRIDALRTLTTEALAVLMPFKAQEIRHRHGIYYGQNAISKNLILADRKELLNGNGFILGVSGSGKSFAAKREITEIALKELEAMCAREHCYLPPFCNFTPEEWQSKGHEYDEVRDCMLGWDITDYGLGDFDKVGMSLITIRNGNRAMQDKYPKVYAEKLLYVKEGQYSPNHFHWYKTEDIINRGGGNILIRVYNSLPDESIDKESDVTVHCDGRTYTVPAGTQVKLTPGESIHIQQYMYHDFEVEPGTGAVLLGEVSQCNDDNTDNRFNPPVGRFPKIEEDETPYGAGELSSQHI